MIPRNFRNLLVLVDGSLLSHLTTPALSAASADVTAQRAGNVVPSFADESIDPADLDRADAALRHEIACRQLAA